MMAFIERKICGVFLFILCLDVVHGSLSAIPRNLVVYAGKPMEMECRATNGSIIYRWVFKDKPGDFNIIYYQFSRGFIYNHSQYFEFDMDENGSGVLYSNSTRLEDAGTYTCYSSVNRHQVTIIAHLTVLESEPRCVARAAALEDDDASLRRGEVILQCSVNFRGTMTPVVEWAQHTDDPEQGDSLRESLRASTVAVFNGSVASFNSSVTSTLIVDGTCASTKYFSYRLTFWLDSNVSARYATNQPDFSYRWVSPNLATFPELITTNPVYTEVVVGQEAVLKCSMGGPIISTADGINWEHGPTLDRLCPLSSGNNNTVQFYTNHSLHGDYQRRYSVKTDIKKGIYRLAIQNVKKKDAGHFHCYNNRGSRTARMYLTVLSRPVCKIAIEKSTLIGRKAGSTQLECSAKFTGDMRPELKWVMTETQKDITTSRGFDGQRVWANATLKAEDIRRGSLYSCTPTRATKPNGCTTEHLVIT